MQLVLLVDLYHQELPFEYFFPADSQHLKQTKKTTQTLTVGCHSHRNALLESTFLALVSGHSVDDAFPLVFTSVGRVEVLLDCPSEEPLKANSLMLRNASDAEHRRNEAGLQITLQPSHVMQR